MSIYNALQGYASKTRSGEVSNPGTYQSNVNINPSKVGGSEGLTKTDALEPSFVKKGEKATKLAEDLISQYAKIIESSDLASGSGSFTDQKFDGKNAFIKFDQGKTSMPIKVKLQKK